MDLTDCPQYRCLLKKTVFRLDFKKRFGAPCKYFGREFQVTGPMYEKTRFPYLESLMRGTVMRLVFSPSSDWQKVEGSEQRLCVFSPSSAKDKTSCIVLYSLQAIQPFSGRAASKELQ